MLRTALVLASLGCLAVTASAQCSTLAITGSGLPGTSLTASLDGSAAGAIAWLAVGETQGTTAINLGPLGTLTLGVVAPFAVAPMGMTNLQGDASLVINVPPNLPAGLDLFGQGITLDFDVQIGQGPPTFAFVWCASNVVGFHVGN